MILCIMTVVCNLVHKFTDVLCLKREAIQGIPILAQAIDKYSPTPNTLTAIHCDLIQVHTLTALAVLVVVFVCVQLCLMAKNLKPALVYLNKDYSTLLTDVCVCVW